MKAKTVLSLLAMVAAAAALAVPAAMADVARYQGTLLSYTLADGSTLSLTVSPCDSSFLGSLTTAGVSETVSGKIAGSTITFDGSGTQAAITGVFSPLDGSFTAGTMAGTLGSSSPTSFPNHGQFVKSVPPSERSAAAHSCIGMPLKSYKAGHGHQQSFANLHGNSASAPGHNKSSSTSTSTPTAPTGPGNGHANANADAHANANASDNSNAGGNGNGNGHGKP